MASFSNKFIDKKHGTCVPSFGEATQISEREALRTEISAIADPATRRSCELRYAYAEEHSQLAHAHYTYRETRYVDANLKLEPKLEISKGQLPRSFEDEVSRLQAEFARSQPGQKLRAAIEEREADLWAQVTQRVAQAKTAAAPTRTDQAAAKDKALQRSFKQARDL